MMTGKSREHNTIKAMVGHLSKIEDELEDGEVDVLVKLFKSNTFRALLKVNQIAKKVQDEAPRPVTVNAAKEAQELLIYLKKRHKKSALLEALVDVLEDPHIQAVLSTHDLIAAENLIPRRAEIAKADRGRVKIVEVKRKPGESLGATIRRNENTGKIVIARVFHGGAAQRAGLLSPEDEVCEVNGVETSDLSLDGVVSLLSLDLATVQLKILPSEEKTELPEEISKVYLKAFFTYDPSEDPNIPCKDAGFAFAKGDILEILESNDTRWWQARKYDDKGRKTGLIPSKQLQERRLALSLWNPCEGFVENLDSPVDLTIDSWSRSPLGKTAKKKSKKVKYKAARSEKFHAEEIKIYEEVTQLLPDFDKPRPIILLGSPGQRCEELCRKLVETDPEKFASPMPYTSRPRKTHEQVDKDYHYLKRHEMEKAVQKNLLINVESVKNYHFGISIKSIEELQDAGKTCVISLTPEYIRNLCCTELHCCVVFLKAPEKERLRNILYSYLPNSIYHEVSFSDEDLERIIAESMQIEIAYSNYFDMILIQNDLETSLNQLYHTANKMAIEPFWIPVQTHECT